jgi:uncharacterized repeat protein (TIGR02543 family)
MKFLWAALGLLVVGAVVFFWPRESAISFNPNGGNGAVVSQPISKGATHRLAPNTFSRAGYSFVGWATSAHGEAVFADRAYYTMGRSGATLWAVWKPQKFTLTFDPDGGLGKMPDLVRATDTTAPLPLNSYTLPGYSFVGWATTSGGNAVGADGALYKMGPANVTLYAVWKANPNTIKFYPGAGQGNMAPQVLFTDQSASLKPNTFFRPGYIFAGWALSPGGEVFYADAEPITMGTSSLNLYAVWVTPPLMLQVPGGSFQRDANAQDTTSVSPFRISRDDITRALFLAILRADPSYDGDSSGSDGPVENVSWYQALAFCNELSLKQGLTPVYSVPGVDFRRLSWSDIPTRDDAVWDSAGANFSANGYRLPTEMEWMWAAMGATDDALRSDLVDGVNREGWRKGYAGSREPRGGQAELERYAVYGWGPHPSRPSSPQRTADVGTKLPNELGIHDLSGNVWQWCWDWEAPYPSGPLDDYKGPATGKRRVLRGGSWVDFAPLFALKFRNDSVPDQQHTNVGFRVARSE